MCFIKEFFSIFVVGASDLIKFAELLVFAIENENEIFGLLLDESLYHRLLVRRMSTFSFCVRKLEENYKNDGQCGDDDDVSFEYRSEGDLFAIDHEWLKLGTNLIIAQKAEIEEIYETEENCSIYDKPANESDCYR